MSSKTTYKVTEYRCRLVREKTRTLSTDTVGGADQACELFMRLLADVPHEEVWVALVGAGNQLHGVIKLAQGGLHACALTTADVLRPVLVAGASAFILCHNHPSGDPSSSYEDRAMTRKVVEACNVVGLTLLDHVIVAPRTGRSYSMMTKGEL